MNWRVPFVSVWDSCGFLQYIILCLVLLKFSLNHRLKSSFTSYVTLFFVVHSYTHTVFFGVSSRFLFRMIRRFIVSWSLHLFDVLFCFLARKCHSTHLNMSVNTCFPYFFRTRLFCRQSSKKFSVLMRPYLLKRWLCFFTSSSLYVKAKQRARIIDKSLFHNKLEQMNDFLRVSPEISIQT